MKHYNLVEKMYLYRKKNDIHNFPFDLISRKNTQNSIYNINNIIKTNNHIKINGNNNVSKINNSSKNNNTTHFIKKHIINPKFTYNNINTNKNNTHIIANNLKMADIIKNRYNYNNSNKNNKTSNLINDGTFFVHTLNANEKDYLGKRISVSNPQKALPRENNKDYKTEINALIKERDEKQNLVKKQKKLIEKIEEDNKKIEKEIKKIHDENNKIKQKIELSQDNQEQLIVLVKIIQKNGVNVEELIDKWNEEVDMENQKNNDNNSNNNSNNNNESFIESNNEVNSHIDSSSFIPITIEKPHVNKKVFNGIPKLNFDIIKRNHKNHKREKYRNKSK